MKKICYGISLIIAIAMCLSLLIFPILKFNREEIYDNHKEYIDNYVADQLANHPNNQKSSEELKEEGIDDAIYMIIAALQLYYKADDTAGNLEGSGSIDIVDLSDAIKNDFYRLKTKGIKYIDLANSIKNQFEYDIELGREIKELTGKSNMKLFFENWCNPFPTITLVLIIAFEFAAAVIVIIRSIKGILGKKKTKLFRMSLFGLIISLILLMMPIVFKRHVDIANVSVNDFVPIFAMNVQGTIVCYYYAIGFAISLILSFVTKFLKD